jgi:hypothetical protein
VARIASADSPGPSFTGAMQLFCSRASVGAVAAALLISLAVSAWAQTSISRTSDDPGYFDLGFVVSALPRDSVGRRNGSQHSQ